MSLFALNFTALNDKAVFYVQLKLKSKRELNWEKLCSILTFHFGTKLINSIELSPN